MKSQHVIVMMTCSIEEQIRKFMYINSKNMIMMMKKEKMMKPRQNQIVEAYKRKKDVSLT